MSEVSEILSSIHDRLLDAELAKADAVRDSQRHARRCEAVLAYLDGLHGPFADPVLIRQLLGG